MMRRIAARAPDPSDTAVQRTVVSVMHDIALAVLVVGQITVAVVSYLLKLLIIALALNHMAPTLVLRAIARTVKSVIMIPARPFISFFRNIDAFCIGVYTNPSSNTYYLSCGGFLFVTTWFCSRIGWEQFHPIVLTLFGIVELLWLVV